MNVSSASVTTIAGSAGVSGTSDGVGAAARFNSLFGLALDGPGTLYAADGSETVRAMALATRAVSTLAGIAGTSGSADGPATHATFAGPTGLAWDGKSRLFVDDTVNDTIRAIASTSAEVTTIAGAAAAAGKYYDTPLAVAYDGLQTAFCATKNGSLLELDLTQGTSTVLGSPNAVGVA